MNIETKEIGKECFIIAEAGSNHNGSLETAKKMIEVAADAGADAVKFQLFRADRLYVENAGKADYLEDKKSIYEIIKDAEMPEEWIPVLMEHCKEKNIIFMASAFDEVSTDILEKNGITSYKLASYVVNHTPLIKHTAEKGKPMIISTGTADMEDVELAVKTAENAGNNKIALMQCVASYPAKIEDSNLLSIKTMEKFGYPVGISDHTRNPIIVPVAATAIGAKIIEKHFTLDNNMQGSDHKYAVEPNELKEMVQAIRKTEQALGDGKKVVKESEKELYDFARVAIHAIKDIKKGEVLSEDNIHILRPGKRTPGMEPKYWNDIIGKKSTKDIIKNKGIHEGDFE